MDLTKTKIHFAPENREIDVRAKTGVSMHCHTQHSKEMLDFIPHYAEKMPIISYLWKKEAIKYKEKNGRSIDFSSAFWAPPMDAASVFHSETSQINSLGLNALVSITDHDSIDGTLDILKKPKSSNAPISLEWTVPFDYGFFHLGVHNLPTEKAIELTKALLDYTFIEANHTNERLMELLWTLNEMPGVLVILNHPLWDIEIVGQAKHELLLENFLDKFASWIHALEVNGFRSWSENKAVIQLAQDRRIPIVTGGDRHGCKPNTMVNVTNAVTFDEFVSEVRTDKRSEIVVMPEYWLPLPSRQLQSFSEILSFYPDLPEIRQRWFDRVFFDIEDGKGLLSLSGHGWKFGGPPWLRAAIWTLGFLGGPELRPLFRIAVKKADRLPKVVNIVRPDLEKMAPTLSSGAI